MSRPRNCRPGAILHQMELHDILGDRLGVANVSSETNVSNLIVAGFVIQYLAWDAVDRLLRVTRDPACRFSWIPRDIVRMILEYVSAVNRFRHMFHPPQTIDGRNRIYYQNGVMHGRNMSTSARPNVMFTV